METKYTLLALLLQIYACLCLSGIIYGAIALGMKMAQKCDFSKKIFFIWTPVQGGRGGWRLSSAGHGCRQAFASEDPVSAPQPQTCGHWGITDFYSGFPGLFMYLAGCLLSPGWLPYPLGFYLMFLLACLPPGLITLAFLSLLQSRGRGCGTHSATLHLQGSPGKNHAVPLDPSTALSPPHLKFLLYQSDCLWKQIQTPNPGKIRLLKPSEGWGLKHSSSYPVVRNSLTNIGHRVDYLLNISV